MEVQEASFSCAHEIGCLSRSLWNSATLCKMKKNPNYGGARPGSGRPASEKKRIPFSAMVTQETLDAINEQSATLGVSRGKVLDLAFTTLADLHNKND